MERIEAEKLLTMNIENLTLEELVTLNEQISKRLSEKFKFYEILNCARTWHKGTPTEDGGTQFTPYTHIYMDKIELYKEVRKSIIEQEKHLREFPQLQAYLGVITNREAGNYNNPTDSLISKMLYSEYII
jgi:hypothetical protein